MEIDPEIRCWEIDLEIWCWEIENMNGKISKTLSDAKTGTIFGDFGKSKTVMLRGEHDYIAFDEYYNEPIGRSFGNCDIYNTTIT